MAIERVVLVTSVLLLVGIGSSRFSARFGLPGLVLFIAVGMAAGSEGLGRIPFENYGLANGVGTIALAIILFDGGLRTSLASLRPALVPAALLATLGVLLTAVITGLAATLILDLSALEGLLLGSIVASTDAAAVFALLRSTGLHVTPRLTATLELESGSNDPMAVFLTLGLLGLLVGTVEPGPGIGLMFIEQMGIGAVVGIATGRGIAWSLGRSRLSAPGLYPLFALAGGLLAFGLCGSLGGSGFLGVYLAGVTAASRELVFRRGILLFHDGAAWLAQIGMFVMLGLLAFPTRLLDVAGPALLIALVLMLVARPFAVATSLLPLGFRMTEVAFVSWAGLKGAVPIVLATFPLLFGVAHAPLIFDVVFFVVLVSAVTQGWSLAPLARRLGLEVPAPPTPSISVEINALHHVNGDIVAYDAGSSAGVVGRRIRDLPLPGDAVVAVIARGDRVVPPRGSTLIEKGDQVFVVVTPSSRARVDRVFSQDGVRDEGRSPPSFPIGGGATIGDLREFYGVELVGIEPERTLEALLRERLGAGLAEGRAIDCGPVKLRVDRLRRGRVERIGLEFGPARLPSP